MTDDQFDWNAAYNNLGAVPNATDFFTLWEGKAQAFRDAMPRIECDVPYGDGARERSDMVWPEQTPKGLVVFVHGGYWMRLSKSYFTHLAAGPLAHGYAVALPGYTLAPQSRISEMTGQIGAAIDAAAAQVDGPIILTGHSAGGHLVSRMACGDSPLATATTDRIVHIMSISGLHDLRPLLRTDMNDVLKLDEAEAAKESAALSTPVTSARITAWVGGGELPEFLRQSRLLTEAWESVAATYVEDGTLNHFTVVGGLEDPASNMCRHLFGEHIQKRRPFRPPNAH